MFGHYSDHIIIMTRLDTKNKNVVVCLDIKIFILDFEYSEEYILILQ